MGSLGNLSSFETEVSNGALVVLILWMLVIGILHVLHEYSRRAQGRHWLRALSETYSEAKPELSLVTFIAALWVRTTILWWAHHAQSHGIASPLIAQLGDGLFLTTTGVMVFALVCWNRHVSPWRLPRITWAMMLIGSLAFSVYFAL